MARRILKTVGLMGCGGAILYGSYNGKDSFNTHGYSSKLLCKLSSKSLMTASCTTASEECRIKPWGLKWDDNWDKRKNEKNEKEQAKKHYIFIRHGEYNTKGESDKERWLTALGREQADLTGKRLAELNLNYTGIIRSNMTRAMETSEIISKHLPDVKIKTTEMLREGAPIPPDPPIRKNESQLKYHADAPRIESAFRQFVHRPNGKQDQPVEIYVCHANVIRYFLCRVMQYPPQAWLRMSLRHGSITWVTVFADGEVSVDSIGDAGHLPPSKFSR